MYLTVPDATDSGKRAVVRASLTAALDQVDTVMGDFREFLASIRWTPTGHDNKWTAVNGTEWRGESPA